MIFMPAIKDITKRYDTLRSEIFFYSDLIMIHVEMGKYGKYAHLIALADLINNVSVKLTGVSAYPPLVDLESMSIERNTEYLMQDPGGNLVKFPKMYLP
jgi:hypothetical protein